MVKSFNQKENQKKKPKKKQSRTNSNKRRRNFPKIRRSLSLKEKSTDLKSSISSRNSETDFCLNISIVNWASIFLEKIKLPKKLHKEFFNNLKILKFTENEFVEWIMYLDDYIEQTKKYDDGTVYRCDGVGYRFYKYDRDGVKATQFGPFFIEEKTIEELKANQNK